MREVTKQPRKWTRPGFKRLGTIRDVAGPNTVGNDGATFTKNKAAS